MAISKTNNTRKIKVSYISVPSQIINSLSSSSLQRLLDSPKKSSKNSNKFFSCFHRISVRSPKLWFCSLLFCSLFGMLKLGLNLGPLIPFYNYPCVTNQHLSSNSKGYPKNHLGFLYPESNSKKVEILNANGQSAALSSTECTTSEVGFEKDGSFNQSKQLISNWHDSGNGDGEFWKQPDGLGYRPCLKFSDQYKRESRRIARGRTRYLLVVVSGGMNQQRNQIVDAVVIARILGAALVVPILQVNIIWSDESEFSDIFDLEHFKRVLAEDVRIVSSLPSTHIMKRPAEESRTPIHASPRWIRSHYSNRFNRDGVLLLRGLDSRLSKDLPSDLQKLRCKVAFQALKFAPRVLELGNKLAERMRNKGPYLALHLRMEKDVWVRTGCLPNLSPKYDEIVNNERERRPELLTAKSNMTCHERKLAGLCPLNAREVTKLLRALGTQRNARIYWAGGEPLGGREALSPLTSEFPHFFNKHDLAFPGELEPFSKRASLMAAIDYIVCEKSDVFMPSHGGNMGHAIQGHRAYAGHKKYITPNKRHMLPYFMNTSLSESRFNRVIKALHRESLGQPELRTSKAGRDVTKYPVPECMCNDPKIHSDVGRVLM